MISVSQRGFRRSLHCWATVIPGLESLLQYELEKLKVCNRSTCVYRDYSGGVELQLEKEQFWRMMCCSRIIESVRIRIGAFIVSNPREIENGISQIPWEKYITKNDNITLRTTIIRNNMFFPRDINSIILERSPLSQLAKSVTTTRQPSSKNVFFLIRGDKITISVDCGFQSTRGYRQHLAETPLKETIAAALCYDSVRKGLLRRNNMVMFDFFCGSGVLAAEMHSLLQRDYPYLQRRRILKEFRHGFEFWPCHDRSGFDRLVESVETEKSTKGPLMRDYAILSSDIAERAIFCSNQNFKNLLRRDANQKLEEVVIPKNLTFTQVDFEHRAEQLVEAIKMNKDAYHNNMVILANPPIYMKQYKSFRQLDQLYHSLFELVYSLKKTDLLRSASILIPHSTQFQLPEPLQEIAALRPLKLGDHTLCLLSV